MEKGIYQILSLDLWDTVIRRKCHPDEIKEKTSDYLMINYFEYIIEGLRTITFLTQKRIEIERKIGEFSKEKGLDDEYEIHEVFTKWIEIVMPQYVERQKLVEELYTFELTSEIRNAYLDPGIVKLISEIPHYHLAYISDFYAGKDFIDNILSSIGCPLHFDEKFISCECGYNKRSGRLFDFVTNSMNIFPEDQIHIGDNVFSDVQIPQNKGIKTIHYLPSDEQELREKKEKQYILLKKQRDVFFDFHGLISKGQISVFFYGFIHWIIESCLQDGIDVLYFFTREGEFYKQVYDIVVNNEYNDKIVPKAEILEVSRLSTFCASLREITLTEMMRIWNQYSIQSLGALFKSLGVEKELILPLLNQYNIPWEEVITYPWQDERVINLFNDRIFVNFLQEQRDYKKDLLLKYLSKKGIEVNNGKNIGIVDIGWRGTIQDNISYLLPNHQIKGYYIGLISFLNEQPTNVVKRGFLNGYEKFDLLFQYVMPFEMICNSPNGSTIEYKIENDVIYAIRKKEAEEDDVYYKYIQKIQQDVITDIKHLKEITNGQDYIASNIRATAHKKLSNFILYPQRIVAQAYFSLRHNEEFGVGEYVDKRTVFRLDLFVKACFGSKYRSKLAQFLRESTWPQGYLTKYYLSPLVKIYNKRYSEI